MSIGRAAAPPQIEGFTYDKLLGSGGFADVYLYREHHPRRPVAIKVMRQDIDSAQGRRSFDSEANLMAQLSSHPFIVTIYRAGVTEDGRPFLVMEYCSRPSLGVRYKTPGAFGIAEALTTGIQLAGAVETVHRAGILHRDIKPANVLVTDYRRPALTDFGISVTAHDSDSAEGLSIPWSPPEAFDPAVEGGVASDVYSLAATIYSLLAGRSPFLIPGGDNSAPALMSRIESTSLSDLGRADVPDSLSRVFTTAMAKDPRARYSSALGLARAFQQVQTELRMGVTPVEVQDDDILAAPTEDDDAGTELRGVRTISPDGPFTSPSSPTSQVSTPVTRPDEVREARRDASAPSVPTAPVHLAAGGRKAVIDDVPAAARDFRGPRLAEPAVDGTVVRPPLEDAAVATEAPVETRGSRQGILLAVGGGVILVAAGVIGYFGLRDDVPVDAAPPQQAAARPVDAVSTGVPSPTALTGRAVAEGLEFSWDNPDPQPGDRYLWRVADPISPTTYEATEETSVLLDTVSGRTCVEVLLRRSDGRSSTSPATRCVEP